MEILLKTFLWLLSLIPFKVQMFLGKILGKILYKLLSKRRKVVTWNIYKCFPDFNKDDITKLAKENFTRLGQGIFEICNSYFWSDKKYLKRLKNIEELKTKMEAIKNSKNLILVPHTGNIDFVVRAPSLFMKVNGMQRSAENKVWDKIMTERRKKFINEVFLPNEGRKLLKALNKGDSVLYLPDQDYGYKKSIFLDFFNHKALTVIFPSLLVKRTRCKVFLLTLVKEDDSYKADLEQLMLTGESVEEDLKIVNSAIENFAQNHKSEYFWIHRRFKNRPVGEENFYPDSALRKEWL
ncbi:lysophospholipid acyltransferase family protein [Gammaproteobacteria bacterium]|nr:lysophospholipid acyltransferase family protein [Gammaproteobacteria bacterium]